MTEFEGREKGWAEKAGQGIDQSRQRGNPAFDAEFIVARLREVNNDLNSGRAPALSLTQRGLLCESIGLVEGMREGLLGQSRLIECFHELLKSLDFSLQSKEVDEKRKLQIGAISLSVLEAIEISCLHGLSIQDQKLSIGRTSSHSME